MQSSNRKSISNSSVVTVFGAMQVLICAAALVHALPVAAQDESGAAPYGLSGSLGVAALSTPTYEGSANRRTMVGPDFSVSYRSKDWGSVGLGQRGLVWQAIEVSDFKLGLAAAIDPGRQTKESSTVDPTPGDKRLAGMGNVRASAEAGVLVGYGPLSLLARRSVGERGHKGTQVDLSAEVPVALSDTLGLRFGAGASWADQRYMQAYFGVTSAQARASGFRIYTPRSGWRKFDASVAVEYARAKDWKLQSAVLWAHLTGEAKDSPVVLRRTSMAVSAGVAYSF